MNVNIPSKRHNLILKCKNLQIYTIEIVQAKDFLAIASSLEQLNALKDPKALYAFYFRPIYHLFLENGFCIFR
jgi:hypothetical protein